MAERPKGYGMTAELEDKKNAKFDSDLALNVFNWIEEIISDPAGECATMEDVQESLKDGVVLCKLVNTIESDRIRKINTSKLAFKQMENISNFLEYSYSIGCKKSDMFQTVDLYEGRNIPQVITGLEAFGRKVSGQRPDLPVVGPKESTQNKREFTDEQLQAGKGVIGLQMGSNKGASQSGMTAYGGQRQIH